MIRTHSIHIRNKQQMNIRKAERFENCCQCKWALNSYQSPSSLLFTLVSTVCCSKVVAVVIVVVVVVVVAVLLARKGGIAQSV